MGPSEVETPFDGFNLNRFQRRMLKRLMRRKYSNKGTLRHMRLNKRKKHVSR